MDKSGLTRVLRRPIEITAVIGEVDRLKTTCPVRRLPTTWQSMNKFHDAVKQTVAPRVLVCSKSSNPQLVMGNPWLDIPPQDYEGHMSSSGVA